MKKQKKSWIEKIALGCLAGVFGWALCAPVCSFADGGSTIGCDEDSDNDYVMPALALCSVHAYNIGATANPDDEATREVMNDVIALKTTIITQQMKKQYDYLDTTVKRLKTQLEKAVLKNKLVAMGADDEKGSSKSGGYGRNIFVSGAKDCDSEATKKDVWACLRYNYNIINGNSNGGQNISAELRKQLAQDVRAMPEGSISTSNGKKCDDEKVLADKTVFKECLGELNKAIRSGYESIENTENKVKFVDKLLG